MLNQDLYLYPGDDLRKKEIIEIKACIPLEYAFASANSRVAKAENDAQTT